MLAIKIKGAKNVNRKLAMMQKKTENSRSIMGIYAGKMFRHIQDHFRKEKGPRKKWKALSEVTLKRRRKKGKSAKILQDTGALKSDMQLKAGRHNADVISNKVYATTQQYGAKKGQFGATTRGAPIPWGKIKPRPFMYMTSGFLKELKNNYAFWVRKGWR